LRRVSERAAGTQVRACSEWMRTDIGVSKDTYAGQLTDLSCMSRFASTDDCKNVRKRSC